MWTPPEQARRIDRLARGAHRFHRWAHHPLCEPYAGEVIQIGRRTRLCRGCASAAAGALGGLLVAGTGPLPPGAFLAGATAVAALWAAMAFRRARDAAVVPRPRRSKLLTRSLPAGLAAGSTVAGLRLWTAGGVLVAALSALVFAVALLSYRRRGPDRRACLTCPEHGSPVTCSGLRPIARREAAFARAAARIAAAPPLGAMGPVIRERARPRSATRER